MNDDLKEKNMKKMAQSEEEEEEGGVSAERREISYYIS
jgi:hypothetical protein